MPFPLFRLPFVALSEVMKTFEVRQLFPLSLCSKRMHQVVKNLRDKSVELKLELRTDGYENRFSLSVKNTPNTLLNLSVLPVRENQTGWRVDEYPEAVFQKVYSGFKSYWADVEDGTRCLMKLIRDLFSVNVDLVVADRNLWVLDMVEEIQGPRSYNAHCDIQRSDEQFRHLLVDLNPTSLNLYNRPSEQFRIENFRKTYDTLDVWHGNWISGDNLLTLDCATLSMFDATFRVAEINRFFRHVLIEEGTPRLTEFRAQVENIDENGILDGIREVLAPIPGRVQFEDNNRFWKFSGTLARGDQLMFVSIRCEKDRRRGIRLEIGE